MSAYKDIESNIKIYVTRDYDRFSRLDGNRSIKDGRVKKILESMSEIGYLPVPGIVNELYQIIDGQGRLEACKKNNEPFYYIIIPGLGISECISMNINQMNWNTNDYIDSYAERGYQSYVYLKDLLSQFKRHFKQIPVIYAATGSPCENEAIKKGTLDITYEQYNKAKQQLSELLYYKKYIEPIGGRSEYYYVAILYCFNKKEINNKKLLTKLEKYQTNLHTVGQIKEAMSVIEDIYNYRSLSEEKIYIQTIYRQDVDKRDAEYRKKYKEATA